jgi:hypothetical protein
MFSRKKVIAKPLGVFENNANMLRLEAERFKVMSVFTKEERNIAF